MKWREDLVSCFNFLSLTSLNIFVVLHFSGAEGNVIFSSLIFSDVFSKCKCVTVYIIDGLMIFVQNGWESKSMHL